MKLLKAITGSVENYWTIRRCLLELKPNVFYKKCLLICAVLTRRFYGSGVPINVSVNPFIAPHGFYGIFISQSAEIGRNCTIYQHVTIGSNQLESSPGYGAPKIGDNVLIGAGAIIIGNVKIGNNVNIGANCIVTEDIPDDCTVVMNKPRVLHKSKDKLRTV